MEEQIFTCPDCGKKWIGNYPESCNVCGCPSTFFKSSVMIEKKETKRAPQRANAENNLEKYLVIGSLSALVIFSLYCFYRPIINKHSDNIDYEGNSYYEESSSSDNNENLHELCVHSWKAIMAGDPYGECMLEVIKFNRNGTGSCTEMHYAGGNKISSSSFDFEFELRGNDVVIEGSTEFYFDGDDLEDASGRRFQSGNSLQY